jgi:hypothetical protein
MNYPDFANVVVNGRKNVNTAQESVMPSFGTNPNVYLRARANYAIARGRPQKHEDKSEATTHQAENSCLGHKS